ncbi:PIN domain-containing protein [Neobacillus sp.]|uniref:tetratricopeptide repeat protein n=1 Tax=Neobacillus sp. TaxID=2675273 RepID=UPI0028967F6A|nr:hypothetical protein [Neobacillus sp.]
MSILGEVALAISKGLMSNLASKSLMNFNDKRAIGRIRLQISDFNRKYDNTEVDSYAFQQFLNSSDLVNEIYTRVFESYKTETESILDFKQKIAENAIESVNQFYEKYSRAIKDRYIFYDYFNDLVDSFVKIRDNVLSFQTGIQTAIITDKVVENNEQLVDRVVLEIARQKEDNIFAEDKINKIVEIINQNKFNLAEQELSEILESSHLLSISQREFVYYQKARILINSNKYSKLKDIIQRIERINRNSVYIAEINYYIAYKTHDKKLFDESLERFQLHNYSSEKILLKNVNFELGLGNYDKALEMITLDGELLNELQEHHEAHFYYGILLNRNGDFNKAYKEYSRAFELSGKVVYKYNALITKSNILLADNRNRIVGSDELFEEVRGTINELNEVRYLIENFSEEEEKYYWVFEISLLLIINPKKALEELKNIDKKLDKDKLIRSIKADVYCKNYMDTEAKDILEELWDFDPINTINLFFILAKEEDWNGILAIYKQIEDAETRRNPHIVTLYIKAKNELEGFSIIRNEIIRLLEANEKSIYFLRYVLQTVLVNQDDELRAILLEYLNSNKASFYDQELGIVGELLNEYSFYEDTRKLIEDRIENCEPLLSLYVQTFKDLDELNEITETYEKVKTFYSNGCRFKVLLQFKTKLEVNLGIPRKVIKTLEEYKGIFGIDDFYGYYYVASKLEKREFDGLNEEVEYLLNANNPSFHQLVSFVKAKQGNWDEAKNLAISAIYLSDENLEKEILMSHISFHFSNIEKEKEKENVTLEEVICNSVVTIKSNDKFRNIAIHKHGEFISESGQVKFGLENYLPDDDLSLILTSIGKKGEVIKLEDSEYEVIDIVPLEVYFFNYCLTKLQEDYPEHEYFIANSAQSTEEFLEKTKKTMESLNESRNKQLEFYNFGVEIGVPISYLSGKNIDSYSEMINSLLNHKNQHFYTGEVSVYEDREYVLSLSSIIVLATFGMLNKLEMIPQKCVISINVEKSIREGIKESQKHAKIASGVLSLNESGKLQMYSYNENDKKNRKLFWTDILITLSKIKKDEVQIEDNSLYEVITMSILDEDISSIELSRKSNRVLVCDDLFIRKLHHGVTGTTDTTNIVGLIISEGLATFEEFIELLLKLIRSKYLYPLNESVIINIIYWIQDLEDTNQRKLYFSKLKEVFQCMLDNVSGQYYMEMLPKLVDETKKFGIPIGLIYELVSEPLKLKPVKDFVNEKSKEFINEYFKEK